MVRFTLKRSLRDDSCCKVEVMNGATGKRRFSRVETDCTVYAASSSAATTPLAASVEPISAVWPLTRARRAVSPGGFFAARSASMVQYSLARKARISRSRSTITRSATVCTRPAERPRRTLSHSSGEIL